MRKGLSLLPIFLLAVHVHSQECATAEHHQYLLENDAEYRSAFEAAQAGTARVDSGQEFTIPVVFHVIHLGEPIGTGSNISDGRILEAFNKLNFNYRVPGGIDVGIRFCMATVDPDGVPTNGIVRVDGRSVANYEAYGIENGASIGADETDLKGLSRWPNTEYYNIWVVHTISGGYTGYAYYPTTYINDGTTIESWAVSGTISTLSHELGHAFNLRHTFEGDSDGNVCPLNIDCTAQGDQICDTPPHKRTECLLFSTCPGGGAPFANAAENFMSYCGLTRRFTPEQRTRLRNAALAYPRNLLAQSGGCQLPPELDGALTAITHPSPGQLNEYCNDQIIGSFILTNTGSSTINTFGITYSYDGVGQSAGYSTFLPSGASEEFILPPAPLNTGIDFHQLEIVIYSINEADDDNPLNDTAVVIFDISDSCVSTNVIENVFSKVTVYPNPVLGDHLYFKGLSGASGKIQLLVCDAIGREVLAKPINYTNAFADLTGLARGTYFATLLAEGHLRTFRIIKQ